MSVLEITTRIGCRVSCNYCPQEVLIREYRKKGSPFVMSLEVFEKCLDNVPKDVEIVFCGMCEPAVNPDFSEMVRLAIRKGHSTGVETTLVGVSAQELDKLKNVDLKFLAIHLPSAEQLERIPVRDDYLSVLEAISQGAIRAGRYYYHYYGEALHPRVDKLRLKTRRISLQSRSGNIETDEIVGPKRLKGPIGCRREMRWNVLLPDGDVLLCSQDYGMRHVIGNLLEQSYRSLFVGEEFRRIEEGLADETADILCRRCDSYVHSKDPISRIRESIRRIAARMIR